MPCQHASRPWWARGAARKGSSRNGVCCDILVGVWLAVGHLRAHWRPAHMGGLPTRKLRMLQLRAQAQMHAHAACTRPRVASSKALDTLGFEPRAFHMRSGCDATTPCALNMMLNSIYSQFDVPVCFLPTETHCPQVPSDVGMKHGGTDREKEWHRTRQEAMCRRRHQTTANRTEKGNPLR